MSSKAKHIWAIFKNFRLYRHEVKQKSHIPTINLKTNPFVIKSVLEYNCKRFCNSAIREDFNVKPKTRMKKFFYERKQLYPSIQWSKREALANFFHLCQNKSWAPGQRHVCISKTSWFFYSSQARNIFQSKSRPPTSMCNYRLLFCLSKHTYQSIRSRKSKDC